MSEIVAWSDAVEWVAAVLALGMVLLNARLHPGAWPLALISSLLYLGVFWQSRLYGQFLLQWVFAAMALWGWWQWRRATHGHTMQLAPELPRSARERVAALGITLGLWLIVGGILAAETDAAAPWSDALPTAGSLVATWMLGRRWPENWWWWLAVNAWSTALFLQQGLLPTAGLYAVFTVLSAWGGWSWHRRTPC